MINSRSTAWRQLKVNLEGLSDEAAARLIAENPRIMWRPVLSDGRIAALGFDKERMKAVLASEGAGT